MLNNSNDIRDMMRALEISSDESKIYVELLQQPSTHLRLSRATGINRTKVYRLIEQLEKRSLVTRRTDDRGTFLMAADPSTLEVKLITQEEKLKNQRQALNRLVPLLTQMQGSSSRDFVVQTYEGEAGMKQMSWHELDTVGEALAFGNGTIEQLVGDDNWARKHRKMQLAANYKSRELINWQYGSDVFPDLSSQEIIDAGIYDYRVVPMDILKFDNQTVVYNDTVAIYNWKHEQKVGLEIISPSYAAMFRQMFEHYWQLASSK